ncbi:hypothetical protein CBS101457_006540 [Exobasidium rhododendri]|nr:hypothetical protein CBS101457_006540 [Exobasidium rhododendri]
MAPARNGSTLGHHSKNGNLPTIDNLREEDLNQLVDSLVDSRQKRREIWDEEMALQSKVPEEEDKGKDPSSEGLSPLQGLKSILFASTSPSSSSHSPSSQTNTSGTSTPTPSTSSGSRAPKDEVSNQMIYQAVLCFWLFSFDEDIAGQLNAKLSIIQLLADVARNAVKEKVVRVIVATLRNLAEKAPSANISAMLGSKCLPLMESLSVRKWSDEEITQDIDIVKEILSEKLKIMSNFDQYISEVTSGRLTWDNPAHSLDEFWKENTTKLLDSSANDDQSSDAGVTMLIKILKESSESTTLAIACNDVGKIITFSPETGKKRVEKEGGKARIMELMSHEDGEVKFYALNTVSRLVSASWRG